MDRITILMLLAAIYYIAIIVIACYILYLLIRLLKAAIKNQELQIQLKQQELDSKYQKGID